MTLSISRHWFTEELAGLWLLRSISRQPTMDRDLFKQMYQGFVTQLQKSGHEIRSSVLKDGTWKVIVNPRPFVVVRTKYDGESGTLIVSTRHPFVYRESLRQTVSSATIAEIAAAAVKVHGPAKAQPGRES